MESDASRIEIKCSLFATLFGFMEKIIKHDLHEKITKFSMYL